MKLVSVKDQPPDDLVRVHLVVEGYYDAVNGIFIEAATDSRLFGVVGWIPQQSAAQETRDYLWNPHGNSGMRHMESADVVGGETDQTWRCTVCNTVNPGDATHCRQCEYSRTVMRDGKRVPRSSPF